MTTPEILFSVAFCLAILFSSTLADVIRDRRHRARDAEMAGPMEPMEIGAHHFPAIFAEGAPLTPAESVTLAIFEAEVADLRERGGSVGLVSAMLEAREAVDVLLERRDHDREAQDEEALEEAMAAAEEAEALEDEAEQKADRENALNRRIADALRHSSKTTTPVVSPLDLEGKTFASLTYISTTVGAPPAVTGG